jgi:hypothetical protein
VGRHCLGWLLLAALGVLRAPALAQADPPEAVPGAALRARLEAHLRDREAELREEPGHYVLLHEVGPGYVEERLRSIAVTWDGVGFVLGNEYGAEPHGGGILALILERWRPGSRPARLEDAFLFPGNGKSLRLAEIYQGHRRQLFLPVPGRSAGAIDGEIPATPQLPRLRFRYPTRSDPIETDAYSFLRLLVAREPDPGATWTNHLGQELSVDRLLENVRGHYLGERGPEAEVADHSNLHLVELLLAYDRRRRDVGGSEEVKRRFLEVELARRDFEGADGIEALAHYAESLGLLLADPRVAWRPEERGRVRDWLGALERRLPDLDAAPLAELAHLLRGLRLVDEHRTRLDLLPPEGFSFPRPPGLA